MSKMKLRESGVGIAAMPTATPRASGSNASGSSSVKRGPGRPRNIPSQDKQSKRALKAKKTLAIMGKKPSKLTAVRVAHIIGQLDNKRGSTMESIRSKLIRIGFPTNTGHIRLALERAVDSGMLREIREERFSLPYQRRMGSNTNSRSNSGSNSSTSRTSNKSARGVGSKAGQSRSKLVASTSRTSKRRQQRRPPQGRRPANDNEGDDDDEGRDMHDEDAGVGNGDVEAEHVGAMGKNPAGSRLSVAEPVAGCDAVMVFGTH